MKTKRVLVVDDEKNIRLTLSRTLESMDLPVQTAVNGEEALEKLRAEEFGLIFLDLRLPGMDGLEVLRRIRETYAQVRLIIITAHGTIESAVEAMKLGAADFLQKPFTPAEIRNLVSRVMEREALDEASADDYYQMIELCKRHITDNRFEEAKAIVHKALAKDPSKPEAYNLLGAFLECRGDRIEAQKYYRAALEIDPSFKPARVNLERTGSSEKLGKIELWPDTGKTKAPEKNRGKSE
jgi:DNA-binding response OmpR family regulator